MYQIFDPPHYLQRNLKCQVVLDEQGEVRLSFAFKQQQPTILKTRKVLEAYQGLLKMQLENGGKCSEVDGTREAEDRGREILFRKGVGYERKNMKGQKIVGGPYYSTRSLSRENRTSMPLSAALRPISSIRRSTSPCLFSG
jgi:hypothetical protein